ncbi:MAG: hypothetical protein LBJ23_11585, partial [Tannerella sp.]|nr:hypothetical protein [Tannerella sp.]
PEWITVTEKGETGKNKLLLLFTASENDSESAREYIISVAELFPEGGSHTMGITVRQDGGIN